ncbi:MAG: ABC transporter ATP-binding protein [Bacteroidota bacterium]
MIRLQNISKRLGAFSLTDITMHIHQGDYVVLLGDSGSGKTVLLEIMAGLIKPDQGEILYQDNLITHDPIRNRPFGIVFQDLALFPHMTVRENLAYPLKSKGLSKNEIQTEVLSQAGKFEINHLLERPISGLSGGERQRTALARTLANNPACLLLDEPLTAIDVRIRKEIGSLLQWLNRNGQTIIHVTHDYLEAVTMASQIGLLEKGRLIQFGPAGDILTDPANPIKAHLTDVRNFLDVTLESAR